MTAAGRGAGFHTTQTIEKMCRVLRPEDAEPPVLARPVRSAVHHWVVELNCADELAAVGVKPRKTALFSGPPGCGKTTLAHHIAARMGVPLVLVEMPALRSKYIGQTGEQVHALFRDVGRQPDACILFLDEFDAIASTRGESQGSGREHNAIVAALLQMIDSYSGLLIAATNMADHIDPAIWRRFGMQLTVDLPDDEARWAILKRYLSPFVLPDEDLDTLVAVTSGATPALLQQLMEGIKRTLVVGPRIGQSVAEARETIARVVAAVAPHPDLTPIPALWSEAWALETAGGIAWPPTRPAAAEAA